MSLLVEAKAQGISHVDHLFPNQATATLQSGARLFLLQGEPNDPAATRAMLQSDIAIRTPLSDSLSRIEQLNQAATHIPSAEAQDAITPYTPSLRLG